MERAEEEATRNKERVGRGRWQQFRGGQKEAFGIKGHAEGENRRQYGGRKKRLSEGACRGVGVATIALTASKLHRNGPVKEVRLKGGSVQNAKV